jgi:hypothetical protein
MFLICWAPKELEQVCSWTAFQLPKINGSQLQYGGEGCRFGVARFIAERPRLLLGPKKDTTEFRRTPLWHLRPPRMKAHRGYGSLF